MTLLDTTHSRDYIILKGRVGEHFAHELVEESAIDPTVALERGCRVAMEKLELKDLGFTHMYHGIEVPALVIPRRSPDGETTRYQIKPKPSWKTKKWGKYLLPPEEAMILDVHPRSMEGLKDLSVPLWTNRRVKGWRLPRLPGSVRRGPCGCLQLRREAHQVQGTPSLLGPHQP
jgi:hypothetical protein